jgi:hypothetical protein
LRLSLGDLIEPVIKEKAKMVVCYKDSNNFTTIHPFKFINLALEISGNNIPLLKLYKYWGDKIMPVSSTTPRKIPKMFGCCSK